MDIPKLSAAKLEALYGKRWAALSATQHRLIDAGFGMERCSDTRKRAQLTGDPLALEYVKASDAFQEAASEVQDRKRYHGSLKPIRRAFA